jgi:signal transduction histidine kinase
MNAHRTAGRLAWGIAAATLASQIWLLVLVLRHQDQLPEHVTGQLAVYWGSIVLATLFPALGAVILSRQPRHVIGWLMCLVGVSVIIDAIGRWYAIDGLYLRPGQLPAPEYGAWLASWSWFPSAFAGLFFIPLLFPDGRLPGRRWRPVAIAGGIWIGLTTAGLALLPGPLEDFPDVTSPVQVPWAVALAAMSLLIPVAIATSFGAVLMRRRRAVGDEREQLRWLIYAMAVLLVGWSLAFIPGEWNLVTAALTLGPLTLLPVAIAVGIVKYRLYDIDVIINRTLVYGGLTAVVLGAYGLVVLAVSAAVPTSLEWRWSVLVVAAVAILAYPLREWLQRLVNRLMYGDRDNPSAAMSRLVRRVADTLTPATLLPAVAETIGQALRLPYVAVELAGDGRRRAATYGTLRGQPHRVDLFHQGEPVGTLLLGHRSEREQFTPADLRVLDDVARQVAVAAHAVRLAEDLQRSRERLVLAREEERRRLRRDLHDGIGSALAGLALHAGNARRAMPDRADEATRWVTRLEDGIRAAVSDVRRIVDDLRPPALDELGLVGALREQASSLFPGAVVVESDADGAPMPAAIEVAAYRIATEALANAARHSGTDQVEVRVAVCAHPSELRLEIRDNGTGVPSPVTPGVGLQSMRERAVEVGGVCEIGAADGGGTLVRAALPIPPADESVQEVGGMS